MNAVQTLVASLRRAIECYRLGKSLCMDPLFQHGHQLTRQERDKQPGRSDVINDLLSTFDRPTSYLEIGVRNPADNFDQIRASKKVSVDPGWEYQPNLASFPLTSDSFFTQLREGALEAPASYEVIFIDGSHQAEQVYRDVLNALEFTPPNGFLVLHDCNPPTAFHAREERMFSYTPARNFWNGTTWKAFVRARQELAVESWCIDSDWGIGVLRKVGPGERPARSAPPNTFYEYQSFDANRVEALNLMDYASFLSELKN